MREKHTNLFNINSCDTGDFVRKRRPKKWLNLSFRTRFDEKRESWKRDRGQKGV